MSRASRSVLAIFAASMVFACSSVRPASAADDEFARIRERGAVHCATIVRPGIAVPTPDGKRWYGLTPDVCRAVAAAVLGNPAAVVLRPYFDGEPATGPDGTPDDIVFLSAAQLIGGAAPATSSLQLGPVVAHDALALMVPADSKVTRIAELAGRGVCVEPGSAADRALTRYFAEHALALREHPFQETDEMRQAYGDGQCAALAGPLSTLASVRADPAEGHHADRVLSELLADDSISAATPADARWSRIVWWTFSALVDAADSGIAANAIPDAIPGVPPAVGEELGLPLTWAHDAVAAGGNYAELFDRNLGAKSHFALARGSNALWRDGGLIYGLHAE
jgi:general L-amino acid transport system substrate-binding protein